MPFTLFSKSPNEKLVERATSELLMTPGIELPVCIVLCKIAFGKAKKEGHLNVVLFWDVSNCDWRKQWKGLP